MGRYVPEPIGKKLNASCVAGAAVDPTDSREVGRFLAIWLGT